MKLLHFDGDAAVYFEGLHQIYIYIYIYLPSYDYWVREQKGYN